MRKTHEQPARVLERQRSCIRAFTFLVLLSGPAHSSPQAFLDAYCERCHNDERLSGNWSLSSIDTSDIEAGEQLHQWENILRVVERGEMPPPKRRKRQPSKMERVEFTGWLVGQLDSYSAANPDPGHATLRRLNRNEYSNAVGDLIHLNVNISDSLPADDTGYGFDNIADVLSVSPTLMDRYMAVAETVSQLAVGVGDQQPKVTTYILPKDGSILNQGIPSYDWRMSDDLPLDSRGGGAFSYYATHDGDYTISAYLNANTNNEIDRLDETRVEKRVSLDSGPHTIGVSFRKSLALDERAQVLNNTTDKVPLPVAGPTDLTLDFVLDGARIGSAIVPSYHMSDRYAQHNFLRDVIQIDVDGPYAAGSIGDTPSREKIFTCTPGRLPGSEKRCAKKIIRALANQAFRQPVTDESLHGLLDLYDSVSASEGFEQGIATALQAILVSPRFIFVQERSLKSQSAAHYQINDYEFATRLALFLWSSLPDATLIKHARKGTLRNPKVLQQQITRMLSDPRSYALTENFAGQWLYLRNLEHHRADVYEYPQFDAALRSAMRKESDLFFTNILTENRSVLEFLKSDYTFVNERLAQHYDIDGINGSAFQKVKLFESDQRGGLLGQASVLTVTSYSNHTSVVRRGKWILDNLLAAPPPPAPPDVPALNRQKEGKALTAREQLVLHSEDPSCASCHVKMDPLGLALENYDAVGGFRLNDEGLVIDAATAMPDGTEFEGLAGLQSVLLKHSDQFASAFTQRLMTYALARGLEAYDQPAVRKIVREAKQQDYAIHSIIGGIVRSQAFNYRRSNSEVKYVANEEHQ